MTAQDLQNLNEPEMGYGQLLSILVRRILWFGAAVAGATGMAIFLTLQEDPVYQSSMQMLVEPNYRETIDITGNQANQSLSQTDYVTQLNLMRSNEFIEKAVNQLQTDYPNLCDGFEALSNCTSQFQRALSLSQVVEDGTETRIFKATITGGDPTLTQDFLSALGDVYLTYNLEQQEQRLAQGLALVNQQIAEVRKNLTASRQELKQFRESESLIAPEQQALSLADALKQIEQDQISVDNDYRDVQAQYNALQQQLAANPEAALISSRLSQSSRYQQLLDALQETELALEQRLALYTEADPGVQDLMSQRQGQVDLLQKEVTRVLGEVPDQLNLDETALLSEGQMGETDLELVRNLVQAKVRLQSLDARRTGLEQAEQQLQTELNKFPSLIAEYDRIQPEVEIQQQSLEQLLQIRQELSNELAQGGFSWDIVEAPQLGEQISPQPQRNLMLGIVAGVFIGGALAFGREAIDNVVHTSDELKKQVTLPLLGVIPEVSGKLSILPDIFSSRQPLTETAALVSQRPFRDAVDLLYKTIQLTSPQPLSSLMVTSALAQEGKTTLSIGLALSAARSHQRVLLIDTNLRNPSLHQRLEVSDESGLSTLLQASQAHFQPVSVTLAETVIDVLPAGAVPDDPVRLLSSDQMQQLLAFAEASYDLVILDAPVILGFADGLQLASLCQGVVMVSRLDKITQADLTQAVTILGQANAIGIVANGYRGGTKQDKGYHRNGHIPTPAGSRPNILNMARSRLPKRLPNHSSRPTSEPTSKPTSKPTPPLPSQS